MQAFPRMYRGYTRASRFTVGGNRPYGAMFLALVVVVGCATGGSGAGSDSDVTLRVTNEVGEPVMLRYLYRDATAAALGQVAASGTAEFTIRYLQGFDLRITGDFVERRTGSSNPIVDLRPGDVLQLTINPRKELVLAKAGQP